MFKARAQVYESKPDPYGKVQVSGPSEYPYRLNFYDNPPTHNVTLEEFESCAIDRLRVLSEIEACFARNRPPDERKAIVKQQCHKYLPLDPNDSLSHAQFEQRRRDQVGHFVLRLAFCRSDELRRRFVKAELELFRVRYEEELRNELDGFLKTRNFGYAQVDDAEKAKYAEQLKDASPKNYVSFSKKIPPKDFAKEKYYKIKWTRVPDLVEHRKVFVRGGWAYVPASEQSSIVFHEFEARLSKALEATAKALPRLGEDTRLVPVLDHLSKGFLAGVPSEWTGETTGDEIRAEMVDDIARKHYPACMRNLHDNVRRDRHLKHFGRLQYGLFLKGLGLSIEEALLFWRKSFSKFTDDQFNKQYKYNIRHSYGLEGGRRNYPPRSCQQILTQDQPGQSDNHGCPFRHFSPDNLETALLSMYSQQGLTSGDLGEIKKIVKDGHYHVACTRVFEITHASYGVKKGGGVNGESVTHPNQYTAKSRDLEKARNEGVQMDVDGPDIPMAS